MESTERFSGRHLDYAAARPSYPKEFLDRLSALYQPAGQFSAADVGSGTGKLSAQLLEAGFTVYGVEPNDDMRMTASQALGGSSRFFSVKGSDRATGLPDRSVDFVTAAQAFHWFDGPSFQAECRRILRGAGRVFLLWNTRGASPLNDALFQVFQDYCPDFHGFSGGIAEDDETIRAFFSGRYTKLKFSHPLPFTREQFLRRCFSSSYSLPESHPDSPAYRRVLSMLFDRFAEDGKLIQANDTIVYEGTLLS